MPVTVTDRIVGCLKGIATGDAIGKQTEMLSHDEVLHWYPHRIRGFEGLATVMESAEEAILVAANIGGDSDSVASIAGGILGAMYPMTVNDHWYAVVEAINHHDLVAIANALARLRH